jgi:hypothetical protein
MLEEIEGHDMLWIYQRPQLPSYQGARMRARHICLRCGAVRWIARTDGERIKLDNGRTKWETPTTRGAVILPFGHVPQWDRLSLRKAETPPCVQTEDAALLEHLSELREMQAELDQHDKDQEQAELRSIACRDALVEKTGELLATSVLAAAKATRSANAARKK